METDRAADCNTRLWAPDYAATLARRAAHAPRVAFIHGGCRRYEAKGGA